MEKTKIQNLNKKQGATALKYIKAGIDFNLDMGNKTFIMYVGDILSKLINDQQFFYINGRGWVGI